MKVLVCGDVEGAFEGVFARAAKLDRSNGPFDALFCCGTFFGPDGKAPPAADVPTYFFENSGAPEALADGAVVAPNVNYLGAAGVCSIKPRNGEQSTPRMLTVAYLSDAAAVAGGVRKMEKITTEPGYLGADLLLSSEWPRGIDVGVDPSVHSKLAESTGVYMQAVGLEEVREASEACRPRYHFAARHGAFWCRAPFKLSRLPPTTPRSYVSRFVALGKASEASKDKAKKWMHAIEIEPTPFASVAALTAEPADLTDSPFRVETAASQEFAELEANDRKRAEKRTLDETQNKDQVVWGAEQSVGAKQRRTVAVDPNSKTLFVGGLAYVTTPDSLGKFVGDSIGPELAEKIEDVRIGANKGFGFIDFADRESAQSALGLLGDPGECEGRRVNFDWGSSPAVATNAEFPERRECWFCLASPGCETHLVAAVGEALYLAQPKGPLCDSHAMLIPIAHASRIGGDMDEKAHIELESFTTALASCFRSKLNATTLAFERYADVKGQFHAHRQVIPMAKVTGSALLARLREKARMCGFEFQNFDPEAPFAPRDETAHYFVADVFDGSTGVRTRLGHVAMGRQRLRVPLQFGREVAAEALGTPERADWKACAQEKDDETALCKTFKALFAPFDPNAKEQEEQPPLAIAAAFS